MCIRDRAGRQKRLDVKGVFGVRISGVWVIAVSYTHLDVYKRQAVDKVLIVCDRGALDNKAYMNDLEFAEAIQFIGSNEVELRDNYDACLLYTSRCV